MYTELQKILVVHHLQEIRENISSELRKKGYHVSAANNGLDGMFAGYDEKFDLILSAMDLPKITGFEMIRTLRTYAVNSGTPVIFIGGGQESTETVAIATKLNAVIIPLPAITNSINKVDETDQFDDLISWVKISGTMHS